MRKFTTLMIVVLSALLLSAPLSARTRALVDLNAVDRDTGRVLPVYWDGEQAFVPGTPGHRYSIRLRNLTGERLLAVVSVDGVNVLSGQTASPDQGGYVLSPWQTQDIDGWRKSMSEVAAFEFTSLGDSYAARTGRPGNVGVIGVAVFRERQTWRPFGWLDRDDDEIAQRNEGDGRGYGDNRYRGKAEAEQAAPSAGMEKRQIGSADRSDGYARAPSVGAPIGTGHGQREYDRARQVTFERASSSPAQVLSLRYDSQRNLVALGIIPSPRGPRYREPDPFPAGFVPDPPRFGYR